MDDMLGSIKRKRSPAAGVISKKKKKKFHSIIRDEDIPNEEETARLEKYLFDARPDWVENEKTENEESQANFKVDEDIRKPVWHDEDDEIRVEEVSKKARRQLKMKAKQDDPYIDVVKKRFESVVGVPRWAKLSSERDNNENESDNETENDLISRCGNMISTKSTRLPKEKIETKQLTHLNKDSGHIEGRNISSVEFHESSSVALVAGASSVVSIFQVDGKENAKLQSIKYNRFPIRCAHFTKDGQQFVIGSHIRSDFHCYDMVEGRDIQVSVHEATGLTNMKNFIMSPAGDLIAVCGRNGSIHLLTSKSKEHIGCLQMNGQVNAICFNSDGSLLYSHGEGEVYVWDMQRRRCVNRFFDDGCLEGTSLALSPDNQLLATGSSQGAVNIYKLPINSKYPPPVKTILNLVTGISSLKFNASSEILAIASADKENAVKLVHFPSLTVFSDFPAKNVHVHLPYCMDFSPSSGYFAVGNNRSKVNLFRLNHFKNY